MKKKYDVVIDGSNVVHDHDNKDVNGKGKITPQRLIQAIGHCENKGYQNVIVFMKKGTYRVAKKKKGSVEGDVSILDDLKSQGKLELIDSDSEDIFWLEFALDNSAFIITRDSFKDKTKKLEDGTTEIVKRERSLYSQLDWNKIDRLKVEFNFLKGQFYAPDLPRRDPAPHIPKDTLESLQARLAQRESELANAKAQNKQLLQQQRILREKQKVSSLAQRKPTPNHVVRRQTVPPNARPPQRKNRFVSKLLKQTKIGKHLIEFGVKYNPHKSNPNRAEISGSGTSTMD